MDTEFKRKEKTKAQLEAENSKSYFIEQAREIALDFAKESVAKGVEFTDYLYRVKLNHTATSLAEETEVIDGVVVYDPKTEFIKGNWEPAIRIIFDHNGNVYYQPQNYDTSEAYKKLCFPIEDLDKYDIDNTENSMVLLDVIDIVVQDKLNQKRLNKIGKQAVKCT